MATRTNNTPSVDTTDTTAYPAYTSKEAAMKEIRDAMEHRRFGPTPMYVLRRLDNTDTSNWSDPTFTLLR